MNDNRKQLFDGITHVDEDLIEDAQTAPLKKRSSLWLRWGAMAACLCLVAAGLFLHLFPRMGYGGTVSAPGGQEDSVPGAAGIQSEFIAALARYPDRAAYPSDDNSGSFNTWIADAENRLSLAEACRGSLDSFLTGSIPRFLAESSGENRVYSPINVYMALAMLAETTDGRSRQQILDALGAESIEVLRERVSSLWNACYQDDGITTCLLAGSLWLRNDMNYIQSTLDSLAEHCYASSFRGEMGSDAYNDALQAWLNEQTGGLLKDYASGEKLDPRTVIALATTVYFKGGWGEPFEENGTSSDTFHSPKGDVMCDFMHQTGAGILYRGDGFSAVSKPMRNGDAEMWFILPDEGVSPEALLDGRFSAFLLAEKQDSSAGSYWTDQIHGMIRLSLPRFDVSSYTDLIPGMQAMGITDVFDYTVSDFSPLTDEADHLFVSEASHAARVKVDEEGVEAAAYTLIDVKATGMLMGDEIAFTLDRPFLFAVTGADGLPLFAGIVNQP